MLVAVAGAERGNESGNEWMTEVGVIAAEGELAEGSTLALVTRDHGEQRLGSVMALHEETEANKKARYAIARTEVHSGRTGIEDLWGNEKMASVRDRQFQAVVAVGLVAGHM